MTQIEDGTGTGKRATVDANNRLHTDAVTRTEIHNQIVLGKAWNVSTGILTLTSDAQSCVFYMKNQGESPIFIDLYIVITGASTGGSGQADIAILRNPRLGTVISTATPVEQIINMDFGSANVPDALLYAGAEGATLTGFDGKLRSVTTASNRLLLGILTNVPQGASVGFCVTPPVGNTSMDIEVVLEIFEEDLE